MALNVYFSIMGPSPIVYTIFHGSVNQPKFQYTAVNIEKKCSNDYWILFETFIKVPDLDFKLEQTERKLSFVPIQNFL